MIFVLVAIANLAPILDLETYRLILTSDGCSYAQSIDLPVKKNRGQCSVEVRYQPHVLSGGGLLYLDDGNQMEVTETMLLASTMVDTNLPLTPMQRDRLKWFYVWLGIAIATGSAVWIYWKMK